MKRGSLILLTLAVMLLTTLPAVGQEEGQELGPDEVVSRILEVFRSLMTNPRDRQEEIKELVVTPEGPVGRPAMTPYMGIFMFYLLFAGDSAEPAVIQEETATVTIRPQPIQFVLTQQEGQWKLDLEATYASLPEAVRSTFEPMVARARGQAQAVSSLNNLRQIALAGLMYAADHEGRLPDADTWMDDLAPYVNNTEVYKSPLAPGLEYGYAMNEALSGKPLDVIGNLAETVLFFESNLGTRNAVGGPEAIADRAQRWTGIAFAFADGHVARSRETPSFTLQLGTPPGAGGAGGPPPPAN